jgi:hypothetical protein
MHQKGIAFEDLPRTFQDFVNIARSIGIKYIWIDSLCIIQGNSRDWHSEAAKMGDVYRNAAFVIAASGAKDSTQGLFINNRSAKNIFRLPYRIADEAGGTFNMMKVPDVSNWHPECGPLEKRAWALQERYLARHYITFMPHGVTWSCKTMSVDESGSSVPTLVRTGTKNWFRLLVEYPQRSLTFPSDRTEALRGVAEDLNRWSRKDQYIPEYGVWQEHLMEQLLWSHNGQYSDEGSLYNKPSWSWVATGGVKAWPKVLLFKAPNSLLETVLQDLTITSQGCLQILGLLSTVKLASTYVRDEYTARDLQVLNDRCGYYRWTEHRIGFSYVLTQDINDGYDQLNLGFACFDNDAVTPYSHACFLGKELMVNSWTKSTVKREFFVRILRSSTAR